MLWWNFFVAPNIDSNCNGKFSFFRGAASTQIPFCFIAILAYYIWPSRFYFASYGPCYNHLLVLKSGGIECSNFMEIVLPKILPLNAFNGNKLLLL